MDRRTFLRRSAVLLLLGGAAAFGWRTGKLPFGISDREEDRVLDRPLQAELAQVRPVAGRRDDGALLSFFILSDLHISHAVDYPSEKLQRALQDIVEFETKVDALILTGDLTESGTNDDYAAFRNVMKAYALPPIHANMGNHEYYGIWIDSHGNWNKDAMPNGKTDAEARASFMRTFGLDKPYHSATLNGCLFLFLSQETYVQETPDVSEGAWYSDEQLRWFQQSLQSNKSMKPVFVMIHQPLPPAGQDGGAHQLMRAKQFRDILKPYTNVFVFYGHNHQDFRNGRAHYFKESFHLFNNSSVGRVLNRNMEYKDESASQGLYVQVYRSKVVVRGRDFTNRAWLEDANWSVRLTTTQ
ncbi:metallophosphoesterase family protein [Paenibacillus koleovorans]|uniref:metallophosphoesterase family protein n=1 Tax=Paenibacillus koleovorans TaxID=121608 RepID=UPI000FDA52F1|nr:metallophosphoesterase [Paenibacillus koleovorans]